MSTNAYFFALLLPSQVRAFLINFMDSTNNKRTLYWRSLLRRWLGYDTVWSFAFLLTFRLNLLHWCSTVKMETTGSS